MILGICRLKGHLRSYEQSLGWLNRESIWCSGKNRKQKQTVRAWRQGRGLLPDLTPQLNFVPLLDHKVCAGGALLSPRGPPMGPDSAGQNQQEALHITPLHIPN